MAKDFLFGFKFLATDYVSPVLKNIEGRIESVNAQVKNTARWREAGTNLAIAGGAFLAAGTAVALALRSTVNASAEMQTEMTHVATAINDGTASHVHLAQAQAMSEKLAIASGLAATQEAQAYYIARSNMLDHAQAIAAMNVATKLTIGTTASLADAQAQLEPTTRLLTTVFQNFGQKGVDANTQIAGFADTMAKLQTQYAFKGIDEVNYAMQYSVPLAKSAGIAFNDMSAALALLSESGLHGAEAGTAFSELVSKMQAGGKLKAFTVLNARGGIDLEKTMERLRMATAGLAPAQESLWLHQIGFTERSMRGVALLIDKTAQYRATIGELNNAQGANAAAFATREASMEAASARLSAAWTVFKSRIGDQLIGPMTTVVGMLSDAVGWMSAFADHHPEIVKFAVTFAAIGAALAIAAGGIAVLVGGLMAVGSYVGVTAGLLWTFTQAAVAISLIGAALRTVWPVIGNFVSRMFSAGVNFMKALASGIWSAITFPARAAEAVAAKVMSYMPWRSPSQEGPMRFLNRIKIVETIAQTIQPGPAIAAIRRTAAAIAIAAPMTLAPMMVAPAMAGAARGAPGGGAPIVLNLTVNWNGAAATPELKNQVREMANTIFDEIERVKTHRERREF